MAVAFTSPKEGFFKLKGRPCMLPEKLYAISSLLSYALSSTESSIMRGQATRAFQ